MPRGPGQSDFVPYVDDQKRDAAPAEEPEKAASAGATKAVYVVMLLLLVALAVLTIVGPHIPAGE